MPGRPSRSGSLLEEDGADVIFVTGAPGSRWSAVAHAVSFADQINRSDSASGRVYARHGKALHFGNYFGPGMGYGDNFDHLDRLSRRELLHEFSRPYADPGGTKLLKSHMFARHLRFLGETFPRARFILAYRPDKACLDWWLEAGGFRISYPDYSWYREVDNMRRQIAVDNHSILEFARANGLRLVQRRTLKPLLSGLGLSFSRGRLGELAAMGADQSLGIASTDPEEIEQLLHARARLCRLAYLGVDGTRSTGR